MPLQIIAVDCCEHIQESLKRIPASRLTVVVAKDKPSLDAHAHHVDLIVIGVSRYPVRRLYYSQLRRVYPDSPLLILRRVDGEAEAVRGEFILGDRDSYIDDLEIVRSVRRVLPLQPCTHIAKGNNYETVREVVRLIAENYSKSDLDLVRVAHELPMSPSQLSRVLNQQVGVSFRQLLRQTRIEEAKRMLVTSQFSIKEVAARVGFTDSHYFSRSFKELTGLSASEYRGRDAIFG